MTRPISQGGTTTPGSLYRQYGELTYHDLNMNGVPDAYEDHRRPVVERLEDLPYDSETPLFPFGHGLRYGVG